MTAALWGAVGTALALLLNALVGWLQQVQAKQAGAAIAGAAVSTATAKVQTAIATAEAAAPPRLAVVDQLKKGTF